MCNLKCYSYFKWMKFVWQFSYLFLSVWQVCALSTSWWKQRFWSTILRLHHILDAHLEAAHDANLLLHHFPLEHGDWLTVKIRMDPCVHQILTRPSKRHSRNRDSSDLPFYLPFLLPFSFFLNSTKRSEIFKPAHLVPTSGTTFRAI